jgi:hypothetical protein
MSDPASPPATAPVAGGGAPNNAAGPGADSAKPVQPGAEQQPGQAAPNQSSDGASLRSATSSRPSGSCSATRCTTP